MSKKQKAPSLPPTPQFQEDPRFRAGLDELFGLGGQLTQSNFSGGLAPIGTDLERMSFLGNRLTNLDFSGQLAPLSQTIELDPEVTRLALQFAQSSLTPAFKESLNTIRQEAANTGALESSTFTDALSKAKQNLDSQFLAMTTQAALSDRERALANRINLFGAGLGAQGNVLGNRISLFGSGLNTLAGAAGMAQNKQLAENEFNLNNYQNLLTKFVGEQKPKNGGFLGGLFGAGGGALAGLALAPFTGGSSLLLAGAGGALGGLAGGFGEPGTGASILNSGIGLFGQTRGLGGANPATGISRAAPGSSASNNPFGLIQPRSNSRLLSQYGLMG